MPFIKNIFLTIIFTLLLPFVLAQPDAVADETVVTVDDIFSTEIKVEDILTSSVMTQTPAPTLVTPEEEGIFIIVKPTPTPVDKIDLQLLEIFNLLKKGNIETAKTSLQKLATELPVSEQSPFALYLSALIENNEESERELLLQLVKRYPDSKWANLAEYKLAEIEFMKGNYKQALNLFLKFARRNPQGAFALSSRVYVAKCLMQEKQYDKAVVLLKGMLLQSEQAKNDPVVYETLAQCFIDNNKFDEAEKILLLIVEKFPNYPFLARVYMNLGLTSEMLNKKETAQKMYEKILATFPYSSQSELAAIRLADLTRPIYIPHQDETLTTAIISLSP